MEAAGAFLEELEKFRGPLRRPLPRSKVIRKEGALKERPEG
jgi:hypothetical protein